MTVNTEDAIAAIVVRCHALILVLTKLAYANIFFFGCFTSPRTLSREVSHGGDEHVGLRPLRRNDEQRFPRVRRMRRDAAVAGLAAGDRIRAPRVRPMAR